MVLTYLRMERFCQPCVKTVFRQMLQAHALTEYGHHGQLSVNVVSIETTMIG